MKITAYNRPGGSRTGTLVGVTFSEVEAVLAFPANCKDDTSKVTHSWGFKADEVACGIWDYKRGKNLSTSGPDNVFKELFGDKYLSLYDEMKNLK